MYQARANNVIAFPKARIDHAEKVLMNAHLLKVFAKIEDEITHQVALEIIQHGHPINVQKLARSFAVSVFCIRRAMINLEELGLLTSSQDRDYQLAIPLI